jgi:ketosteroid isomerase-like protein
MKRFHLLALPFVLILLLTEVQAQDERKEDHEALRRIRETATKAINSNDFSLLAPVLHDKFSIITVDGKKFSSLEAFRTYWGGLFSGDKHPLQKIEVDPQADALTEFLSDSTGVVQGTSTDKFHFSDGDVISMKTRWTAVLQKDKAGWKLATIHFSADLMDNPVLDIAKSFAIKAAVGGVLVGLLVGGGLMFLVGRQRGKKSAAA